MSDHPRIDLIVASPIDDDDLTLLITVNGKMTRYVLRRRTAASVIAELATALSR